MSYNISLNHAKMLNTKYNQNMTAQNQKEVINAYNEAALSALNSNEISSTDLDNIISSIETITKNNMSNNVQSELTNSKELLTQLKQKRFAISQDTNEYNSKSNSNISDLSLRSLNLSNEEIESDSAIDNAKKAQAEFNQNPSIQNQKAVIDAYNNAAKVALKSDNISESDLKSLIKDMEFLCSNNKANEVQQNLSETKELLDNLIKKLQTNLE